MSKLPPELITDILSRLPVKSLLRFRRVSKPWRSQIDSPGFVKLHLYRSIQSGSNLCLAVGDLLKTGRLLHSVSLHSLDALHIPIELKILNNAKVTVLGSCDGLCLLQGGPNDDDAVLFNPSTRKYRCLPATPIEYPKKCANYFLSFGFGYDLVNDDYKVLKTTEFRNKRDGWISTGAKVFSLKSNSWKTVQNFGGGCHPPYPNRQVWGVHVKGFLHSVMKLSTKPHGSPIAVLGFDLCDEKCSFVALPDFASTEKNLFERNVVEFGGCLCVLDVYGDFRTDVWVMKDYGVRESWSKVASVAPPAVEPYACVTPLVYSKCGREIMLNYDDKKLIWYDLERKTVRDAPVRGLHHLCPGEVYVESLVSLDGYGKVDGVKKQMEQDKSKEKKSRKR
ncbi:hypothetical protein RJ639_003589 [Escallonia herrerae]|uniref:F-box domain-containing protein n=1 Tax=Escallonia herrerae TaxID=1293975 RepID=A0AA88W2B0_9ASTE|nr:hypothetical protein RJ639_003589 [Escallonia herrerae]